MTIYDLFFTPNDESDMSSAYVAVILLVIAALFHFLFMAIINDLWFNPWNALTPPRADTRGAELLPLINGPVFGAFWAFFLLNFVWTCVAIFRKAAPVQIKLWKIGFGIWGAYIGLLQIGYATGPLSNLWATVPTKTYAEYVNFNHYLRTIPFIVIGFLFTLLYFAWLRSGDLSKLKQILVNPNRS